MKVPESFLGKLVAVQFGRPVYRTCRQGSIALAHDTYQSAGPLLVRQPDRQNPGNAVQIPLAPDLHTDCLLTHIGDGCVVLRFTDQDGSVIDKLVNTDVIVAMDTVAATDCPAPRITRAEPQEPQSPIVQLVR